MDINLLINDPELKKELSSLKRSVGASKKKFSDIIDDAGNQYVDLVMEGGGMLGIALVGYTYILEQMGLRFLGVGGTSAGSINALLVAALDTPEKPKSPKLLELLANKNFFDFVDGDSDARDFIETFIEGAGPLKLGLKAIQVVDNLTKDLGLNPGDAFENWIKEILADEGIRTRADLIARMNTVPAGLRTRSGEILDTPEKVGSRMAIVSADVSTETKVIFPEMADLYWKKPDKVNPASFVRASMSIPFFFMPYRVKGLPRDKAARKRWQKVGFDTDNEKGGIPKSALFIDGGIMSNFPINIFHDPDTVPISPTFGVKLEYDNRRHEIQNPFALMGAIFNSARHCQDYDFIRRNPDYKNLVQWIPAQQYNWLDFNMSDKDKRGLFKKGAQAAIRFLRGFDWEEYKKIRRKLMSQ